MKHVYVAGAYSAPDAERIQLNVDKAIDVGNRLIDHGLFPYVPHLSHYQHARKPRHYEDWMALDFAWVRRCDALLRLEGDSSGADREVAFANANGIPVFHAVSEVIAWATR
jgi:nucleoside 2-deoxyribosyltransferase